MSELSVGQLKGLTVNNNTITVPAGHTFIAPGSTLQVVSTNYTTRASTSLTNNTVTDIPGLSCTITPKTPTSKILVMVRWMGEFGPADGVYNTVFGIKRNGARIGEQPDPGATVPSAITVASLSYEGTDADSTPENMNFFLLDTPGTTSAVTYQVFALTAGASRVISTNKAYNWSNQSNGYELGTSSIVLMEIAA